MDVIHERLEGTLPSIIIWSWCYRMKFVQEQTKRTFTHTATWWWYCGSDRFMSVGFHFSKGVYFLHYWSDCKMIINKNSCSWCRLWRKHFRDAWNLDLWLRLSSFPFVMMNTICSTKVAAQIWEHDSIATTNSSEAKILKIQWFKSHLCPNRSY